MSHTDPAFGISASPAPEPIEESSSFMSTLEDWFISTFGPPKAPPIFELWFPLAVALCCFGCNAILMQHPYGFLLVPVLFGGLAVIIGTVIVQDSCESPGAYAGSISAVCASILDEGYPFMLVSLVMAAYMVIDSLDRDYIDKMHRSEGIAACLTILGVSMTTITGMLPDRLTDCKLLESDYQEELRVNMTSYAGWYNDYCGRAWLFSTLHIVGITGGITVSIIGTIMGTVIMMRKGCRFFLTGCLTLFLSCGAAVFAGAFYFGSGEKAALMHVCILHQSEDACLGKTLSSDWSNPAHSSAFNGTWPCVWRDDVATDYPCVSTVCKEDDNLYKLQWKIVAEYDALVYWMFAVCGFVLMMIRDGFLKRQGAGGDEAETPARPSTPSKALV